MVFFLGDYVDLISTCLIHLSDLILKELASFGFLVSHFGVRSFELPFDLLALLSEEVELVLDLIDLLLGHLLQLDKLHLVGLEHALLLLAGIHVVSPRSLLAAFCQKLLNFFPQLLVLLLLVCQL